MRAKKYGDSGRSRSGPARDGARGSDGRGRGNDERQEAKIRRVLPGNDAGTRKADEEPANRVGPMADVSAGAGAGDKNALAVSVGKEIRSLRLGLKMPANKLASGAGMSKGMLSKIERGTATPSFSTLMSLSTVLKVPVARLFAGHVKREDFSLVRAGKGIEVQRRGPTVGFHYELLGHLLSGEPQIEPYLVTISDAATAGPGFQHSGIEFMYILKGAMRYRYADTIVELYPGDTLVFDANAIHGHERLIESPVKFISIVISHRS